mmetsp:Transcript_37466/g.47779  ORF Transcript_37466/g.47779 Transcript_37466/m.47779 type:complete len:159 (+) Transcript_37466:133-609(+)
MNSMISAIALLLLSFICVSAFVVPSFPINNARTLQIAGSARLTPSMMAGQEGIATLYIKQTCPHCKEAIALLKDEYQLDLSIVDIEEGDDAEIKSKIRQMKQFSFRKTVPQVFFNSKHLGGNDDVQTLHKDGKLAGLIDEMNSEGKPTIEDGWFHPHY